MVRGTLPYSEDAGIDLAGGIEAIRAEASRRGKASDQFDLSVLTGEEMAPRGIETRIGELVKLGFNRILFMISPASPDKQRPVLDRYAALIRKFV